MATLYRCRTPTNWLCPCGRVARELGRRGVEYDTVRVPWRRADRAEVRAPSGQTSGPGRRPAGADPAPGAGRGRRADLRLAPDRRASALTRRAGRRAGVSLPARPA